MLFIVILIVGCSSSGSIRRINGVQIPSDWKKIENEYFSFYAPNDLKGKQGHVKGYFNGEYKNENINISFVLPQQNFKLKGMQLAQLIKKTKKIKISGSSAEFGAANIVFKRRPFAIAVAFFADEDLLINAISKKRSDLDIVKRIIKSIKIKNNIQNRVAFKILKPKYLPKGISLYGYSSGEGPAKLNNITIDYARDMMVVLSIFESVGAANLETIGDRKKKAQKIKINGLAAKLLTDSDGGNDLYFNADNIAIHIESGWIAKDEIIKIAESIFVPKNANKPGSISRPEAAKARQYSNLLSKFEEYLQFRKEAAKLNNGLNPDKANAITLKLTKLIERIDELPISKQNNNLKEIKFYELKACKTYEKMTELYIDYRNPSNRVEDRTAHKKLASLISEVMEFESNILDLFYKEQPTINDRERLDATSNLAYDLDQTSDRFGW